MNMRSAALSCACLAGFCAPAANAIEAAPIIVDAPELATVPPPEVAAAAIRRTPGGVDLVPATVYLDGHAVNLHDIDRKSTRLNHRHQCATRMPPSTRT